MKTALFTWEDQKLNRKILGQVTLKDDGKVSVNLFNARGHSSASRYQAKQLANQIVNANFKHEAAEYVKEDILPTGLIDILTEKTQELKEIYIQQVRDYAKNYYTRCSELNKRTEVEWFNAYGVLYTIKERPEMTYSAILQHDYENMRRFYEMDKVRGNVRNIIGGGFQKYETKEIQAAERHYTHSIQKLAYRLNQKGITDGSDFKITSARVGINLEIIIKHGAMITRAFTVWAEGFVNRPHYRYLIK